MDDRLIVIEELKGPRPNSQLKFKRYLIPSTHSDYLIYVLSPPTPRLFLSNKYQTIRNGDFATILG
jgi:hypothetical protein